MAGGSVTGTIPGMFDKLWKNPLAKYVGVLGLVMPLVVFIYYTVIVGWLLGFSFFSITGDYFGLGGPEMSAYLSSFQNIHDTGTHGGWVGFLFYGITLAIIVWVLSRGISGGNREAGAVRDAGALPFRRGYHDSGAYPAGDRIRFSVAGFGLHLDP